MAFERLPETTQTLYAELLEQVIHAQAEAAVGATLGTFVSKQIKGATYWYFQRQEGDRKRQHYLGRRPGDLALAWEALQRHSAAVEIVREALARLDPGVRERLESSLR